ncbi:hypothetical protein GQ54DRAFT_296567, partial [Martensiomyces pterosporus]
MNRTPTKRRAHAASTISVDMSIKYPYPFTSMSISPYSRDIVLAGRAGLAIIDLEFPLSPPRTIAINSLWKVAGVAWCPSRQQHSWVGTTVNQTLLIHDLAHTTSQPMRVLKSHPMAITDIAWAPKIPSWIGTTSIDPVIKIWDVRRDQKPVWYYSEWESADLLAFNNVQMHKLATVHRNKIAVWDIRFGSSPLVNMEEAHADDINGICWHPAAENVIVSASQDRTVKRWCVDSSNPTEEYSHSFPHEVLSAKYTPFGEGLLVKQKSPDNSVLLISDSPQLRPVHRFTGHTDTVLGSEWRTRGEVDMDGVDAREFQLVTWGRDEVLRMWAVEDKVVESVGGSPDRGVCNSRDYAESVPSFATNFLGPDQVLHLIEQKALPSELLLAASKKADMRGVTTIHEFNRTGNMLESIQLANKPPTDGKVPRHEQQLSRTVAGVPSRGNQPTFGARSGQADERSSDDDDESDGGYNARKTADSWKEEVGAIAIDKYGPSGTVELGEMLDGSRRCTLKIGVPWVGPETMHIRIDFPADYPQSPLHMAIERAYVAHSSRDSLQAQITSIAAACAKQSMPALDRCLHALLCQFIKTVRAKTAHGKQAHLSAEDLERLPPPPPPQLPQSQLVQRGYLSDDDEPSVVPDMHRKRGLALPSATRGKSKALQEVLSVLDRRWQPNSFNSEDDNSILSNYNDEYGYSDEENVDEYSDDDDDDEDGDVLGYDDADDLYYSDNSQSGIPVTLDGLPISLRHANNRDRYDSHTPFPRLCGGVFSGPGQLVCFFSSIYTPDTYPEQSGLGSLNREKNREDMSLQLRALTKPRNMTKLKYYQSMVQFGLQNKGTYLSYGGGQSRVVNSGSLGGGFGESDDDEEARGEEVPQYYFRQQISRNTLPMPGSAVSDRKTYFRPLGASRSEAGVGNMALICSVPQDRSADYDLAKLFVLAGPSTEWICQHNANVASLHNRAELAHVWGLLACLLGPVSKWPHVHEASGGHRLWSGHPSILMWFRSVMVKYERRGDAQTLALLACVLSKSLSESTATAASKQAVAPEAAASDSASSSALPPWMCNANGSSNISQAFSAADQRLMLATKTMAYTNGRNASPASVLASNPNLHTGSAGSVASQWASGGQAFGPASLQGFSHRTVTFVPPAAADDRASLLCTHPPNSITSAHLADGHPILGALHGGGDSAAHQRDRHSPSGTPPSFNGTSLLMTQKLKAINLDHVKSVHEGRISAAGVAQYLSAHAAVHPFSLQSASAISQQAGLSAPPFPSVLSPINVDAAALLSPETGPLSPDILEGLDSEEIKQHELMMAEGISDPADAAQEKQTAGNEIMPPALVSKSASDVQRVVPEHHVDRGSESSGNDNGGRSKKGERNPSAPPSEQNPVEPEAAENIWRRLRTNVLGRVHTAQGDSSSGKSGALQEAASTAVDRSQDAANGQGTKKTSGPPRSAMPKGQTDDAGTWNRRPSDTQVEPGLVRPWDLAHIWMPLVSGFGKGAAAQSVAKEVSYLRMKRDFEHPHTALAMRDRSEWDDQVPVFASLDYRCHAPYLDHWKFTYARILYKWRMDAKAIEVLKCVQDPDLRELYNKMYAQPTEPKHDNILRIGNPVLAGQAGSRRAKRAKGTMTPTHGRSKRGKSLELDCARGCESPTGSAGKTAGQQSSGTETPCEISGAPWLSCAWCHEYVHGRALICHACGHGGHQEHMLKWFRIVRKQLVRSGLSAAHALRLSASNSSSSSSSNLRQGLGIQSDRGTAENSISAVQSSLPSGGGTRNTTQANTAENTRTHTRNPTLTVPGDGVDTQPSNMPEVTISPPPP